MRHVLTRRGSVALAAVLAVLLVAASGVETTLGPASQYGSTHFGDGNLPPGCILDMRRDNPDNVCHHGKVGLNALDSPQIDVAVLVPVSPAAERDMRIMRQAIEAWEAGLDYLAEQMGLYWLAEGVDFHITVDAIDLTGGDGGEFTTYPLYDPEIVVIGSSPAGGVGIGIDPVDFTAQLTEILGIYDDEDVPCHGIPNPFDLEYWEALPGFDSHHEYRGGTNVEDCGGAGGNVCFAVNGAVDAIPGETDMFSLFDLVLHEVGHCLTLGHVGDGAEGDWGVVPTTDIMAYSYDPPGLNKCVSTLNVEQFALRMSRYLDVDGDGRVDESDLLVPNDLEGDGLNSFQVQHPDDHLYASSTGSAWDCPQPDLGLVPGEPTDWTPEPVAAVERVMDVTSPANGSGPDDGVVRVTGTVAEGPVGGLPTATSATVTDPAGDATTPVGDIEQLDVEATDQEVVATLSVPGLLPDTTLTSVAGYSVSIGFRQIDTFVDPQDPGVVTTYDHSMETPLPSEWAEWDLEAGTVTFRIPRSFLADANEHAPYDVVAWTNYTARSAWHVLTDDRAPDEGRVQIAAPPEGEAIAYELPADESVDPLDLVLELGGDGEEGEPPCRGESVEGECVDRDGDEVPDTKDACPEVFGLTDDGCILQPVERVNVYVDGTLAGFEDVSTASGADEFAIDVPVSGGAHELTVEWEKRGRVLDRAVRAVVSAAAPGDPGTPGAPVADPAMHPLPATGGGSASLAMLLLGLFLAAAGRVRGSGPAPEGGAG